MKPYILLIILTIFFYSCSNPHDTAEEKPLNINGTVLTADSIGYQNLRGIIVELVSVEQNFSMSDSTDANGFFSFDNLTLGSYTLSINNTIYFPLDSTFYLSNQAHLELRLLVKEDYFPLSLNNEWLYKYDYYVTSVGKCVGVPYKKYFGFKKWVITDVKSDSLYEFTENEDLAELKPEFDGSGCVVKYDTLHSVGTQTIFYIREEADFRIFGSEYTDLFNGVEIKRFHPSSTPNEMDFRGTIEHSSDYNTEIGVLKKNTGLTSYYYVFGSSSHHFDHYELNLLGKKLN